MAKVEESQDPIMQSVAEVHTSGDEEEVCKDGKGGLLAAEQQKGCE